MTKLVWPFVGGITGLSNSVVSFWRLCFFNSRSHTSTDFVKHRKNKGTCTNCLLSIDHVKICIELHICKKFDLKKSKKSTLQYEVGLCIKTI
jgi:hypothetical protein